jgi:hypothetical protein
MNINSERGQAEIAIALILAVIAIAALFGMLAPTPSAKQRGKPLITPLGTSNSKTRSLSPKMRSPPGWAASEPCSPISTPS